MSATTNNTTAAILDDFVILEALTASRRYVYITNMRVCQYCLATFDSQVALEVHYLAEHNTAAAA